jgi:hypothetical protein
MAPGNMRTSGFAASFEPKPLWRCWRASRWSLAGKMIGYDLKTGDEK